MNMFSDVKVQILINSVAKRPGVYDRRHPEFKDAAWKERAWKEIAQNVNANEKDCKVAWRSLRDQFMKSVKNGKKYKHFKRLIFLKDTINPRNISYRDFDENTVLEENSIEVDSAPAFVFEPCASQSMSSPSSDNESVSVPINEITPPSSNTSIKREKDPVTTSVEDFLNGLTTQNSSREPDNVDMFFKSVAYTVKSYKLSTSELAVLQCEVLNFVTDRLEHIRTNK